MKQLKFIFLILLAFFLWNDGLSVHAELVNVKDCIENNEECLEDVEEPVEFEDSNNELLQNIDERGPSSIVFNFIKMFFALLLILALLYGILIILRRRKKLYQHSNLLENVGGIPLGPNKSIQIVRVGSSLYLIGVGDNIEMLQEITDEELKTALLEEKEEDSLPVANMVFNLFQGKQKKNNQKTLQSFSENLQEELKKFRTNRKNLMDEFNKKDDEHV